MRSEEKEARRNGTRNVRIASIVSLTIILMFLASPVAVAKERPDKEDKVNQNAADDAPAKSKDNPPEKAEAAKEHASDTAKEKSDDQARLKDESSEDPLVEEVPEDPLVEEVPEDQVVEEAPNEPTPITNDAPTETFANYHLGAPTTNVEQTISELPAGSVEVEAEVNEIEVVEDVVEEEPNSTPVSNDAPTENPAPVVTPSTQSQSVQSSPTPYSQTNLLSTGSILAKPNTLSVVAALASFVMFVGFFGGGHVRPKAKPPFTNHLRSASVNYNRISKAQLTRSVASAHRRQ